MRYLVEGSASDGRSAAASLYAAYAALFLGVALALGAWLRATLVWPWLEGPFSFGYLLHAHSHAAFFGWATPALFAFIVLAAEPDAVAEARLRVHARALAILSAATVLSFALTGYSGISIVISAGQVVLWYVFAVPMLRRLGTWADGSLSERRFYRAALLLLLLVGAVAVLAGVPLTRDMAQPWLKALGAELFLTPFIDGWLVLGVMGATYGLLGGGRGWSGWARILTALGAFPATLLFAAAPPPWPGALWLGRAGALALGLGGLAFALDTLAAWPRAQPLLRLASLAALTKAALEVLAALGVGAALLHDRSIVLAYLHLTLLGLVTPVLLSAYRQSDIRASVRGLVDAAPVLDSAGVRTFVHALGLAVMCGALLGLGWPALAQALARHGLGSAALLVIAFAGGALSVVALLTLLVRRAGTARTAETAAGYTVRASTFSRSR